MYDELEELEMSFLYFLKKKKTANICSMHFLTIRTSE